MKFQLSDMSDKILPTKVKGGGGAFFAKGTIIYYYLNILVGQIIDPSLDGPVLGSVVLPLLASHLRAPWTLPRGPGGARGREGVGVLVRGPAVGQLLSALGRTGRVRLVQSTGWTQHKINLFFILMKKREIPSYFFLNKKHLSKYS